MTNQHDKEMREAFEAWAVDNRNLCVYFNGIFNPQAWNGWQAATTRYEAALREAREALERANQCQFQRYYLRDDGSAYLAGDDDAEYVVKKALTTINEILGEK